MLLYLSGIRYIYLTSGSLICISKSFPCVSNLKTIKWVNQMRSFNYSKWTLYVELSSSLDCVQYLNFQQNWLAVFKWPLDFLLRSPVPTTFELAARESTQWIWFSIHFWVSPTLHIVIASLISTAHFWDGLSFEGLLHSLEIILPGSEFWSVALEWLAHSQESERIHFISSCHSLQGPIPSL